MDTFTTLIYNIFLAISGTLVYILTGILLGIFLRAFDDKKWVLREIMFIIVVWPIVLVLIPVAIVLGILKIIADITIKIMEFFGFV
ncbi:MAG TPA: hypothetical protein DC057_03425 [Spirochaetia bacterium]|nr:hypothetical protein [Spirochaetia bacterium]